MRKPSIAFAVAVSCLYLAANAQRIYVRKYFIWLPDALRRELKPRERVTGPVHVLFLFTDNFEPGCNHPYTHRWEREYPALADRHRDSSGRPVQHTWFYPGEEADDENLSTLRHLVAAGYGEVELHYHHKRDNEAHARATFRRAIEYFQRYQFLRTVRGNTRFAFFHGSSALDNSIPELCGVNRELDMPRSLGCFADFTFPIVWSDAQPSTTNSIYHVLDDDRNKSYDSGTPLEVGRAVPSNDLVMLQGPLVVVPSRDPLHLFWKVEDGNIHAAVPTSAGRVDSWVRANVHVVGRPEWVFVKVFAHGASVPEDMDECLGANFEAALSYLENHYNDGTKYVLHYITAREAYNIARAAADGQSGDPGRFLDWEIAPYVADGPRHSRTAGEQVVAARSCDGECDSTPQGSAGALAE